MNILLCINIYIYQYNIANSKYVTTDMNFSLKGVLQDN